MPSDNYTDFIGLPEGASKVIIKFEVLYAFKLNRYNYNLNALVIPLPVDENNKNWIRI